MKNSMCPPSMINCYGLSVTELVLTFVSHHQDKVLVLFELVERNDVFSSQTRLIDLKRNGEFTVRQGH